MIPKPGDKYKAKLKGPLVEKNRGIKVGSEWFITCTNENKISLALHSNNPNGWTEITIAKTFFGENFEKSHFSPMGKNYIEQKHFYPGVNERAVPLKPI